MLDRDSHLAGGSGMAETLSTASSEKGGSNQRVLGGKTKAFEGSDLLWVGGQSLGGLQRSVWIVMVSAENRLHFSIVWVQPKDTGLLAINFFQGDLELALALLAHKMKEVFHADLQPLWISSFLLPGSPQEQDQPHRAGWLQSGQPALPQHSPSHIPGAGTAECTL